jgi:hypothetical protein
MQKYLRFTKIWTWIINDEFFFSITNHFLRTQNMINHTFRSHLNSAHMCRICSLRSAACVRGSRRLRFIPMQQHHEHDLAVYVTLCTKDLPVLSSSRLWTSFWESYIFFTLKNFSHK